MANRPWLGCFFPPTKSKIAENLQERHVGTPIGVTLTILKRSPSNRITPPDNGTLDGRSGLLQWHCPDGDPPIAPPHCQPAHPSFRGPPTPPRSPRSTTTRQCRRRRQRALGAAYRRTLRRASRKEQALMVNRPRFGSLKHKGKTFPPSQEIETLPTVTVVGVKDATSNTTTKFELETLVHNGVTMMTEAVRAESLTTLRQHTKTLTTMTIVGDETSVTNSDAKINSENQTGKSTTSTAVGSEVTTTPRQQTKTSLTTLEAVVANPVIEDVETTMTDNPSDVEFDTNTADNEKDTTDNADDPLDEEFRAIDTFVTSLTVAKPSHHCTTNLAKVDPPDGCIDMSTYCTQNVHGL